MSKQEIIEEATNLISYHYGPYTAKQYQNYYYKKNEREIMASLDELLSEILGPKVAKQEINRITKA